MFLDKRVQILKTLLLHPVSHQRWMVCRYRIYLREIDAPTLQSLPLPCGMVLARTHRLREETLTENQDNVEAEGG